MKMWDETVYFLLVPLVTSRKVKDPIPVVIGIFNKQILSDAIMTL
jgi:hypothetical protein